VNRKTEIRYLRRLRRQHHHPIAGQQLQFFSTRRRAAMVAGPSAKTDARSEAFTTTPTLSFSPVHQRLRLD
jgi:hypothetical protein